MTHRKLTLKLVAAALATLPLLAQADGLNSEVTPDGWLTLNGYIVRYVGAQDGAANKTREQVRAELAAHRANPFGHDGWLEVGGRTGRYVSAPTGTPSKTRAEVLAELEAHRRNPVNANGWVQEGDAQRYVGVPARAALAASAAPTTVQR